MRACRICGWVDVAVVFNTTTEATTVDVTLASQHVRRFRMYLYLDKYSNSQVANLVPLEVALCFDKTYHVRNTIGTPPIPVHVAHVPMRVHRGTYWSM
jgi:hypothetical protein